MRNIEIELPSGVSIEEVAAAIDRAIVDAGLSVTLRGSLKKFPGCTHWHAKLGRQAGTLEITLWPQERRAWFTIQNGRAAPWISDKIRSIASAIGQRLAKQDR
jgi:hypothetical protein